MEKNNCITLYIITESIIYLAPCQDYDSDNIFEHIRKRISILKIHIITLI